MFLVTENHTVRGVVMKLKYNLYFCNMRLTRVTYHPNFNHCFSFLERQKRLSMYFSVRLKWDFYPNDLFVKLKLEYVPEKEATGNN